MGEFGGLVTGGLVTGGLVTGGLVTGGLVTGGLVICAYKKGQLGGLAQMGQASAAGTGAAAQGMGTNVANLLAAQGAATAGRQVAAGKAFGAVPSAISGGLGLFSGLGGKF